MPRHPLLNAAALDLQFFHESTHATTLGTQCCSIHHSANFRIFAFFLMLRHWNYCQFWSFFQCCGIGSPMLQHSSLFFFFVPFSSFLSSFDSNARAITYNIKYHVNVSKMIIILTKLLSIRALKHINFTHINDHR